MAKTDGSNWDYELYFNSNDQLDLWVDDGTPNSVESTGTITDTSWHHVAVTRSGTAVTFYIDGAASGGGTMTGDFGNAAQGLIIGDDEDSNPYNGYLDEIRLSSDNRSGDWIEASFLSQNGIFAFTSFGGEEVQTTDKAGPVVSSVVMSDSALTVGHDHT